MKNGVISARLSADYLAMIEALRLPGERDGDFVRRAIDALALLDEDFSKLLAEEEPNPLESDREKYIYD